MDASHGVNIRGYGFVLRNQYEHVMIFGTGPLFAMTSVEHAKAMAMWISVAVVSEFWHHPIIVAIDYKRMVNQLLSEEVNLTSLDDIVVGLQSLLQQIPISRVVYNHWNSNCVAHRLARIESSIPHNMFECFLLTLL